MYLDFNNKRILKMQVCFFTEKKTMPFCFTYLLGIQSWKTISVLRFPLQLRLCFTVHKVLL